MPKTLTIKNSELVAKKLTATAKQLRHAAKWTDAEKAELLPTLLRVHSIQFASILELIKEPDGTSDRF